MRGADIGRLDCRPRRVVVQEREVAQHLVEAEGQVPADVLKHEHVGPQDADSGGDVRPEVTVVAHTLSPSRV